MTELETAMWRIGFKRRYESYPRLKLAVLMVLKDDNRMRHVQRDVYMPVAESLGCTWQCVEHSIRARIKTIWKNDPHAFDCLCRAPLIEQPTAADLIEYLAEYVRSRSNVRVEIE